MYAREDVRGLAETGLLPLGSERGRAGCGAVSVGGVGGGDRDRDGGSGGGEGGFVCFVRGWVG